jgi:hypothetical protein
MANRKESIDIASKRYPIRNRTERIFRVFLDKVFPNANIAYEPEPFSAIIYRREKHPTIPDFALDPMMGAATTRPDFRITKPNGKKIYIEITKDRKNGTDPKQDDKEIMRIAAPNYPYVVLYGDTLLSIQRKYREFNFFKSEKKKEPQVISSKKDKQPKKFTIRNRAEMGNRHTIFQNCNKH